MRRWGLAPRWVAVAGTLACSTDAAPTPPPTEAPARVTLRVTTIGGQSLPAAYVRAFQTSTIDSAAIGADGRAQVTVPRRDSVTVLVGAHGASHYGSKWRERFPRDTTIDVILIPRSWTVQRGLHAGATRVIDLERAISNEVPNTHFLNAFAPGERLVSAWPVSALPIAVGFDTTGGAPRWTVQDSVFFWAAVAELNRDIGREVFRPVSGLSATRVDLIGARIDPDNPVSRGVLASQCDAGQRLCNRRFGQIWMTRGFSYPGLFANQFRRTVKHELMHALGFGHACFWPSVMSLTIASCLSLQTLPTTLTADDAAYMELMFDLATALESRPAAWTIAEALAATLGPRAGTTLGPLFSHHAIP